MYISVMFWRTTEVKSAWVCIIGLMMAWGCIVVLMMVVEVASVLHDEVDIPCDWTHFGSS